MSSKRSRIHPKCKTKYRVGNWPAYDRSLVARGSITGGGPRKFSDLAIETALTLRLVFPLPLRQAEGFLQSLLGLMQLDLDAPDHTTLSRRSRDLEVRLRSRQTSDPIHLIVDSTGLSIMGESEWAAVKHGRNGRRGWKKLHLGVDASGVIVAEIVTDGVADDGGVDLQPCLTSRAKRLHHRDRHRALVARP